MSLGVLDTPLTWREVPKDKRGYDAHREANFTVQTPKGPTRYFVYGAVWERESKHILFIDFGYVSALVDPRMRAINRRWVRYRNRHSRRRSLRRYLQRTNHRDLAYYTRFMEARGSASMKAFTIISTVADIVSTWIEAEGVRFLGYEASDDTRGRLYATMIRVLAPKARLVNEPEDWMDRHIWDLRP